MNEGETAPPAGPPDASAPGIEQRRQQLHQEADAAVGALHLVLDEIRAVLTLCY